MLKTQETNQVLSNAIKQAFIRFCHARSHMGHKLTQADFDLMHDFRDYLIRELETKDGT